MATVATASAAAGASTQRWFYPWIDEPLGEPIARQHDSYCDSRQRQIHAMLDRRIENRNETRSRRRIRKTKLQETPTRPPDKPQTVRLSKTSRRKAGPDHWPNDRTGGQP